MTNSNTTALAKTSQLSIVDIKKELDDQLKNPETLKTLIVTTFKGLNEQSARSAMLEGMMRGFSFVDFINKDIYAVPFSSGYSLVTSIDYARKIGMRSGIVGKSAPTYEEKDDKLISCTVTVKRKVPDGYVGDFTATVYFSEYNTGRNQWVQKPRTMIAKVAEMHALRMACPEEMAQSYIEEEYQKEKVEVVINIEEHKAKLEQCKNLEELKTIWASMPAQAKTELATLKEELKKKYESS